MASLTDLADECQLPSCIVQLVKVASFQISSELLGPVKLQLRDLQPSFKNSI